MIVGFSRHGTGKGAGPVDYVLDQDRAGRQDRPPELVRGDPELTKNLIDASDFKHKYTSGVLSFAPNETITKDMENKIMDRFEQVAFSGLNQDQYNILWVRHTHAGHHELHFVTPRVELSTGNSLNIKPPGKNTQDHYDNFRSEINARYGLADPEDPARKRDISKPNHEIHTGLKAHRSGEKVPDDLKSMLNSYLSEKAVTGQIRSREDVLDHVKQLDLTIKREGKDYITVHDPESNKRFRMKGALYERDFTPSRAIEKAQTGRHRDYSKPSARDAERFARAVDESNERKAQYHRQRYNRSPSQAHETNRLDTHNALSRPVRDVNDRDIQILRPSAKRHHDGQNDALSTRSTWRQDLNFRLRRESMHRDTSQEQSSILLDQRREILCNPQGEITNDRTRTDLAERVTRITNSIRESATAVSKYAQDLAERIRRNQENKSVYHETSNHLRREQQNTSTTSEQLADSSQTLDRTNRKLERSERRNQGMSR